MQDQQSGLLSFRQQWQQELAIQTNASQRREPQATVDEVQQQLADVKLEDQSPEDQARSFFQQATLLERQGKVFEAIPLYKKAVRLVPDIEYQIHVETMKQYADKQKMIDSKKTLATNRVIEQGDELDENVDLYARFFDSIQENGGKWCEKSVESITGRHISDLPVELILIITRWIVSNDLDVQSLERSALVCKGFYLHARDPEIWRLICLKVWGVQLGSLVDSPYSSFRQMYFERSRLRFNGCYISKTEYFRLGENSFQDSSYKPVHHVEYYRYLRFFPDGNVCLMLTTADEPGVGVKKLKSRQAMKREIMNGYYRLNQDIVTIVLHRKMAIEVPTIISEKRTRAPPPPDMSYEQTFHVELQVQSSSRKRRFNQLHWRQYRVIQRRNGIESSSDFHLDGAKFPVFYFSRVEHYLQETNSILSG